ncbi:MAG: efflux RND transporter periplasmic adaptor subunit [Hyphomicrobiales bacterium]|nr:efflux RND transporter periplasmic adaptor subunit [Hyphomicrobiales bacterium]
MKKRLSLSLLSAAILVSGCDQKPQAQQAAPPPPPVTVAQPLQKTVTEWDEYTGRFDAVDFVEVRSRISGVLNEVKFRDGDMVKKGDLLFVIDPRPFERVLEREKANLASAQVRAEFTAKDVERARPLLRNATISEQVFDQRTQAAREAEAAVRSAEASVRSAELDVEFTRIAAPISGRISRKLVTEGNYVTGGSATGTLLTTIVSLDPIYFYFDVSENDYLKYARLDQSGARPSSRTTANPIFLALQDETGFPHGGKMDFVDNRLDSGTGTLRGRAVFENKNGLFSPGLFARARLVGSGEYKALMLPDAAIASDQSNRIVFVAAEDGSVSAKQVTLGPVIDGLRVIRGGVEPTDWIIVSGVQRARVGAKVTPQRATLDATGTPVAAK